MALTRDYHKWHAQRLRDDYVNDPAQIADYLSACLNEGQDVFLVGVRNVVDALEGMTDLAENTNLSRKHLYEMLSEDGNPRFRSISRVLEYLGMHLQCVPGKPLQVS